MDKEKKFDEFSNAITRGLNDDVELQLGISQEIKSHMEDAFDSYKSEGKNDEESVELAMRSFGPSESIGEDLLNANRRRMKLRATARLVIKAVVIPLAVFFAVYVCFNNTILHKMITSILDQNYYFLGAEVERAPLEKKQKRWHMNRDNKVYHADYITHFLGKNKNNYSELIKRMEIAEKYEPENARYNYVIAGEMLDQALSGIKKGFNNNTPSLKDRHSLDKAIEQIIKGAGKPYFKRYGLEMSKERINLIDCEDFESLMKQMSIVAGTFLPDLSYIRTIGRSIPFCAGELVKEGKKEEAKKLLDCWLKIIHHLNSDSWTLVDVVVTWDIGERTKIPEAYENAGFPEEAKKARTFQKKFNASFEKIWPRDKNGKRIISSQKTKDYIKTHGGILLMDFLPALGNFSPITKINEADFRAERELERTVAERYETGLVLLILLSFMLFCGLVVLAGRLRGKKSPILLLPDFKESIKILGLGIVLPLICYFLYSRIIHYHFGGKYFLQTIIEVFSLLTITIIYLTANISKTLIMKRCYMLGILDKMPENSKFGKLPYVILALMWTGIFVFGGEYFPIALAICCGIFFAVWLLFTIFHAWKTWKVNEILLRTIANSLLPIFAFAIIMICLLIPGMKTREKQLIKNDRMFNSKNFEIPGFSKVELDLTLHMKNEVNKVLNSVK